MARWALTLPTGHGEVPTLNGYDASHRSWSSSCSGDATGITPSISGTCSSSAGT